jgi:hypothetical protein
MRVQVFTVDTSRYHRESDKLEAAIIGDKFINWNDSSDRKWLVNHQHWALNNGCAVMVRPADRPHDIGCSHIESN